LNDSIGIIGGTGPEGRGLALRLGLAGLRIYIGSRNKNKAQRTSDSLLECHPRIDVIGLSNEEVAVSADLIFIAVPYIAQIPTLKTLERFISGKTVVVIAAPIHFHEGVARATLVDEGSAAMQVQKLLPDSSVVSAFQTISHSDLLDINRPINADVVVCSDRDDTRRLVMDIAEKIDGIRAVNGGGLENSVFLENFVALLINLNKLHKTNTSIKFVGI
tara:strand:+ start:256 stop:909 length:654 start_codon:yes stop_codon:yes gene_type:complete